jgi:DNA polymerase-1
MLLQIHDELVFEAPAEQIDALAQLVVQEMTSVMPLRVPLKVDVKTGQSWADTEAWN